MNAVAAHLKMDEAEVFRLAGWFTGTPSQGRVFVTDADRPDLCNVSFATLQRRFDTLLLGPTVRLYPTGAYESFVSHCASLVEPSGLVGLRKWGGAEPRLAGVDPDWLIEYAPLAFVREDSQFAYFSPAADDYDGAGRCSIYDWYRKRGLAIAALYAGEGDPGSEGSLADLDLFAGEDARARCRSATYRRPASSIAAWSAAALPTDKLQVLENAGLGTGVKVCYLEAILAPIARRYGAIDVLDLGTGTGSVAVELLLSRTLDVRSVTAVDPSWSGSDLLVDSIELLRPRFGGSFFFDCRRAQDVRHDRTYHAITFLGSLFHVSRDVVTATLRRAWDALMPGGALVVYESVREAKTVSAPYRHKLFRLHELEALLRALGDVTTYHPSEVRPCTSGEAGVGRVFRIVEKP